ncbi:alpha/beta fold hydrolase [Streptomyces anulatus]
MSMPHRLIGSGDHQVLVLHDWFGTSSGWGPVLDYLDGDAFSYALLDYRGYGDRKTVGGVYTLAEIADDALALADELGWETFSLIGHSMGGKAPNRCWPRLRGGCASWSAWRPFPPVSIRWTATGRHCSTVPRRTATSDGPSWTWSPADARPGYGST